VEIAASGFGRCEIGAQVCKWLNVGMSEKPDLKPVYVAAAAKTSFVVNSLSKDFATVVHNSAR
jgi:hypothetical protein